MSGRSSRFPFTANQWQELEHQALIFKYMVSGIPIPPDLLFTIKRSSSSSPCSSFDSAVLSSKLFPSQSPHVGWSCFQLGLGRKIDPEPGRCRRTDGKKWRCSKEAYPDSKYCERHMHRGKNRSRKPVEVATTTLSITTTTNNNNNSSSSPSPKLANYSSPYTHTSLSLFSSSTAADDHHHDHHLQQSHYPHPPSTYNHNHLLSSSHPSVAARHQPPDSTRLLLDSAGYCSLTAADFRSRSIYGLKEDADHERAFFSETSGSMRSSSDDPWQLSPLGINASSSSSSSSSSSKQRSSSGLQSDYSYLQLQSNLSEESYSTKHLVDGKAQTMMRFDRGGGGEETQKTTVHRFFDEGPPKNIKDQPPSWLDLDSSTRLSISIPSSSSLDFPIFNSRTHQHH